MAMEEIIETKINHSLAPVYLEIINESNRHSGPATDSHFKIIAVSDAFEGVSRIQRHRKINQILATELETTIHALSLQLFTLKEWEARHGAVPKSPPCMGGSKQSH